MRLVRPFEETEGQCRSAREPVHDSCKQESSLRAQNLKNFKILKFSSEIEIFKRATHQPLFLWGILKVEIENFKRDWKFSSEIEFFKIWALRVGLPPECCGKRPQSNESYERKSPWDRTISTVLWVHRRFPRSTACWVVAKGSSVSWVAKLQGDKNPEWKLSNGW